MVQRALPALNAVVRDVQTMAMMLRAIAFTSLCQITISTMGIQVITEVNGVLQATAYLTSGLFAEYDYHAPQQDIDELDGSDTDQPPTVFEVSLSDLLVCLNIYGNAGISTQGKSKESDEDAARRRERERQAAIRGIHLHTEMRLIYAKSGQPLILELQEGSTSTRCELATFIANTALITDMDFLNDRLVGQVIMESKELTEPLQSIDTSTKEVTISFLDSIKRKSKSRLPTTAAVIEDGQRRSVIQGGGSSSIIIMSTGDDANWDGNDEEEDEQQQSETIQMMRIRSEGDTGSTELDFPNQHKVFEQFNCSHNSSTTFQYIDLQRCLRALQTSLKTSLRIDDQGMMSLQCLFPRKVEHLIEVDSHSTTSRIQQTDPEKQGFVELKILPVYTDEE